MKKNIIKITTLASIIIACTTSIWANNLTSRETYDECFASTEYYENYEGSFNPLLRYKYEVEVRSLADKYLPKIDQINKTATTETDRQEQLRVLANQANMERRVIGLKYKAATPEFIRNDIYRRNLIKYGDIYGPSIEMLVAKGKSYEDIIKSSCRPGGRDYSPLGFANLVSSNGGYVYYSLLPYLLSEAQKSGQTFYDFSSNALSKLKESAEGIYEFYFYSEELLNDLQ